LLDAGAAAPPAERAQPEVSPNAPEARPAAPSDAEADTEPDTSAADTTAVGAAPADVDLDDPVDQQTIAALAEIQTLLQSEGLDDMVRDHQAMAGLIKELKGLVINADEVRQAVIETTALRRRKAEIERDFALPTRQLPYGALMQDAAADGTPYCAAPRPAALQADIDAFCGGIDDLVAAFDAAASDGPEPRLPDRRQLHNIATRIRHAGEEPLKAIYTEPRRRVWLAHRIPGINALERERALRMAHNIVLRHAAALRQLRDHYRAPRDVPPLLQAIATASAGRAVEIEGQADDVGSDAYNLQLSTKRALAMLDFWVAQDHPTWNLRLAAFGETRPARLLEPWMSAEQKAEARNANRRIAFMIHRQQ
jgi:hypothetical protein